MRFCSLKIRVEISWVFNIISYLAKSEALPLGKEMPARDAKPPRLPKLGVLCSSWTGASNIDTLYLELKFLKCCDPAAREIIVKTTDKLIVIDDRTVKMYNDVKNEYETYVCSNFAAMSPSINEGLIFFGPESKYAWLEFGYYPIELNNGEILVSFYSICYLGDENYKSKLSKNKQFDFNYFDLTTDLNQIIWEKKSD